MMRRIGASQVNKGDVIVLLRNGIEYKITLKAVEPDAHVSLWGKQVKPAQIDDEVLLFENYPPDAPVWRVEVAE